jgi:hypothetical protein
MNNHAMSSTRYTRLPLIPFYPQICILVNEKLTRHPRMLLQAFELLATSLKSNHAYDLALNQ